jgi:DNA-binding helix-hairpin-helix protein with protein kinase domain
MNNSNLAMSFGEFAQIVSRIDSPDSRSPPMLAAAANCEMQPRPRPIPARRRIQIRDQGLRAFRVF